MSVSSLCPFLLEASNSIAALKRMQDYLVAWPDRFDFAISSRSISFTVIQLGLGCKEGHFEECGKRCRRRFSRAGAARGMGKSAGTKVEPNLDAFLG